MVRQRYGYMMTSLNNYGLVSVVKSLASCLRNEKDLVAARDKAQDELDRNSASIRAHRVTLAQQARLANSQLVICFGDKNEFSAVIPYPPGLLKPSRPEDEEPCKETITRTISLSHD